LILSASKLTIFPAEMHAKNLINLLQFVDSTNNYAMRQVHEGMAEHGMAWLARQQTAGKGQAGKQWETAPGENILMSIVLDTKTISLQHRFTLSAAVASACHAFVNSYAGKHVFIKWPNDIYYNDSKAGGILIENVIQGQTWKWAVVGLGININQVVFPAHLPNPVSLRQITGLHYSVEKMAEELHQKVLFYFQQLVGGNQQPILHYYNHALYKRERPIRIHTDGRVITATLKGISEEGKLLIEETEEAFDYGDVRLEWETAPTSNYVPNVPFPVGGKGNGED
jgi:BirA family biotin operon repressor/biotin-[acetyl-CoA-carboxylase] ligase